MHETAWYAPETSTRFHSLRPSIHLFLYGLLYTAITIKFTSLTIIIVNIRQTINMI